MQQHVGVQRSDEEARGGARIVDGDDAGLGGAAEVRLDDADAAARRAVVAGRIERRDEQRALRARVHVDDDVLGDDAAGERDELLGDPAQHDARVFRPVDGRQLHDERRRLDAAVHRLGEERAFRRDVAQDSGRRDVQLAGDVGQRGGLEPLRREDVSRGGEELFTGDSRRPAHL